MADNLNVVIVGHNNQTKCEVANALYRQRKTFKTFHCTELDRYHVKRFTVSGIKPLIINTPCLATPSWQKSFRQLSEDATLSNKYFIYVKDISSVRVNDLNCVKGLKRKIKENEQIIIAIPFPSERKQRAEREQRKFDKCGFTTVLLNMTLSVQDIKNFSARVFAIIAKHKSSSMHTKPLLAPISQSVPSVGVEMPENKTHLDTPGEDEDASLIRTVQIDSAARPSTPTDTIELDSGHWEWYRRALSEGKTLSYHTRVNVVGYHAAGKTTLIRRLMGVELGSEHSSIPATEGLDIDKTSSRCIEEDNTRLWDTHEGGYEKDLNFQRMAASMVSVVGQTSMLEADRSDSDVDTRLNPSRTSVSDITNLPDILAHNDILYGSDAMDDEIVQKIVPSYSCFVQNSVRKEYLSRVMSKVLRSPGMRRYISYWDFAGQSTYYTTHQAFMAPAAVYLLVVDLSKPLEHEIKDSMEFRTHCYQKTTILDAVRFWAGSIKSFARDENNVIAPIIVVGTHADAVKDNEDIDGRFDEIRTIIGESDLPCIAVENKHPVASDEKIPELKNLIIDKALGILERQVKANWIDLEYMIILLKDQMRDVISRQELIEINKGLDQPLKEDELFDFLEHEHCNGFLMHFNADGLKDTIILQPKILVDFINVLLLKAKRTAGRGLNTDGVFDQTFLEDATSKLHYLETNRDELLSMLIHLKIIFPKEILAKSSTYFMPCLLRERPKPYDEFDDRKFQKSSLLQISFCDKLIPPGFFHTLIVSMMFAWTIDTKTARGKTVNQVFYHYCRFRLTESGGALLEVFWSDSNIFLQFINLSERTRLQDLDCLRYLKTIMEKVANILKTYRHENLIGRLLVKCPQKEHMSFLPFDELLRGKEARCDGPKEIHMVSREEVLSDWTNNDELVIIGYRERMNFDSGPSNQEIMISQDHGDGTEPANNISPCTRLSDEILARPVTKPEMVQLSKKIGKDYTLLFVLLNLDLQTIQRTQQDNSSSTLNIIFHLFVHWSKQLGNEATVGRFLKGVREFGHDGSDMFDIFS